MEEINPSQVLGAKIDEGHDLRANREERGARHNNTYSKKRKLFANYPFSGVALGYMYGEEFRGKSLVIKLEHHRGASCCKICLPGQKSMAVKAEEH